MKTADRGMRIPGAGGAVLLENLGETPGIFGQILKTHSAVFDK